MWVGCKVLECIGDEQYFIIKVFNLEDNFVLVWYVGGEKSVCLLLKWEINILFIILGLDIEQVVIW